MVPPLEPLDRLRRAPLEVLGRIVESSNATFLVAVGELPDVSDPVRAVYKPLAGERPLWDFPEGLHRREVAAYELSVALGWDLVPGTVLREDAPLGEGSLQRFVEADFARHYFVLRDEGRHDDQLMRLCAFDLLANNTDRKAGHVLVDEDEHIWGIDNALCFSTEARLRTVIWDFAGEPLPDEVMDGVTTLLDAGLPPELCGSLLAEEEVEAVLRRARVLRSARRFPHDPTGRRIPWPLI